MKGTFTTTNEAEAFLVKYYLQRMLDSCVQLNFPTLQSFQLKSEEEQVKVVQNWLPQLKELTELYSIFLEIFDCFSKSNNWKEPGSSLYQLCFREIWKRLSPQITFDESKFKKVQQNFNNLVDIATTTIPFKSLKPHANLVLDSQKVLQNVLASYHELKPLEQTSACVSEFKIKSSGDEEKRLEEHKKAELFLTQLPELISLKKDKIVPLVKPAIIKIQQIKKAKTYGLIQWAIICQMVPKRKQKVMALSQVPAKVKEKYQALCKKSNAEGQEGNEIKEDENFELLNQSFKEDKIANRAYFSILEAVVDHSPESYILGADPQQKLEHLTQAIDCLNQKFKQKKISIKDYVIILKKIIALKHNIQAAFSQEAIVEVKPAKSEDSVGAVESHPSKLEDEKNGNPSQEQCQINHPFKNVILNLTWDQSGGFFKCLSSFVPPGIVNMRCILESNHDLAKQIDLVNNEAKVRLHRFFSSLGRNADVQSLYKFILAFGAFPVSSKEQAVFLEAMNIATDQLLKSLKLSEKFHKVEIFETSSSSIQKSP